MPSSRRVAVVSPSTAIRPSDPADVVAAASWAASLGWEVEPVPGWDACAPGGAAGSPELRAEALMSALENSDAVFCSSGGDHAHELLAHLDRRRVARARGWFVGTSDNSMLAFALASLGATAFCGPDMKVSPGLVDARVGSARPLDFTYTRGEVSRLFERAGARVDVPSPPAPSGLCEALRPGDAFGPLVAMNLRCLLKLAALPDRWDVSLFDGAVLLLEAFRDDAQSFSAMLDELASLGVLSRVAALGIGWLHAVDGTAGDGRASLVADAALSLTPAATPVWRLGVFGHRCPHAVLPMFAPARLADGVLSVSWPQALPVIERRGGVDTGPVPV